MTLATKTRDGEGDRKELSHLFNGIFGEGQGLRNKNTSASANRPFTDARKQSILKRSCQHAFQGEG